MDYMQITNNYYLFSSSANGLEDNPVDLQAKVNKIILIHRIDFLVECTNVAVHGFLGVMDGIMKSPADEGSARDNALSYMGSDSCIASLYYDNTNTNYGHVHKVVTFKEPYPVIQNSTLINSQSSSLNLNIFGVTVYFTQKVISKGKWLELAKRASFS